MTEPTVPRTRYALIGTGARAQMYLTALADEFSEAAELVCWADSNAGRLDWSAHHFLERGASAPAVFAVDGLAEAIREHRIDSVIVTTPDHTHARYIVEALNAGADVDRREAADGQRGGRRRNRRGRAANRTVGDGHLQLPVLPAQLRPQGGHRLRRDRRGDERALRVGARHGARGRLLPPLAPREGELRAGSSSTSPRTTSTSSTGGPTRDPSASSPAEVCASTVPRTPDGASSVSGRTAAPPIRSCGTPSASTCGATRSCKALYFDQEGHDGYLRDRDVFDEGITIEDNLSLIVDYDRGHTLTYSLNAHSPWEGYVVAVNGTKGRAELTVVERGAVLVDESGRVVIDPSARPDLIDEDDARPVSESLVVQRHFSTAEHRPIPEGDGGHGGGDARLLRDIFVGVEDDPLGLVSTWQDGVQAMVVGLAGNRSLDSGQAVAIAELDLGAAGAPARGGSR